MLLTAITDRKTFTLTNERDESADFHIQAIPPAKWRELATTYGIEKSSRKEQLTKRPVPGQWRRYQKMYAEAAGFALIDSNPARRDDRKAQLPVLTEATAAVLTEVLGEEIKVGAIATLDGHWTDEIKAHVFLEVTGGPDLADWICKQAKKLGLDIAEDEEGKD